MFDRLQHHSCIEPGEFAVRRFERPIAHLQVSGLYQGVQAQRLPGSGDSALVDVNTDQTLEHRVRLQALQQFACAATQVQDTRGTGCKQFADDCIESLAMQWGRQCLIVSRAI